MTTTRDIGSRNAALMLELARMEGQVGRGEPEQWAKEIAALGQEQAKVISSLRNTAEAMRSARLKTERLLKSERKAEDQAVQELTRRTNQFENRISQIKLHYGILHF